MKKILPLLLLFLLVLPSIASAHSKMTTSMPQADSTETVSPEQISMEFNTDIESISTFQLFNEQNEEVAIEQITVDGHTLSGQPAAPLDNGLYKVEWSIIGADGHAIKGEYSFTVDAPVVEATPEPTPVVEDEEPAGEVEPTPTVEPSTPTELEKEEPAQSKSSTSTVLIIIVAAVVVLAIIFVSRKRK